MSSSTIGAHYGRAWPPTRPGVWRTRIWDGPYADSRSSRMSLAACPEPAASLRRPRGPGGDSDGLVGVTTATPTQSRTSFSASGGRSAVRGHLRRGDCCRSCQTAALQRNRRRTLLAAVPSRSWVRAPAPARRGEGPACSDRHVGGPRARRPYPLGSPSCRTARRPGKVDRAVIVTALQAHREYHGLERCRDDGEDEADFDADR